MADKVKVRFTRFYKVQDEEGKEYEEGKSYSLSPDSAEHFIRRGAAELDDGKKKDEADKPTA